MEKHSRVAPGPNDSAMPSYSMEKNSISDATIVETNGKYATQEPNGTAATNGADAGNGSDEENKDKKEEPIKTVGFLEVFKYSSMKERVLMVIGTIFACAHGAALPIMIIIFGNMTDLFIDSGIYENIIDEILPNLTMYRPNITKDWILDNPEGFFDLLMDLNMTDLVDYLSDLANDDLLKEMRQYSYYYIGIGGGVLIIGFVQVSTWQTAAYGQCERIRVKLVRSILRQDIGWFDVHEVGELNTRISDDVDQIEAGIGEKLSMFFQQLCSFLAGFIVGFIYGWKLTLVILAVSPLLAISGGFMAKLGANMASKELKSYAKAGAVAEEVLGALRTVVAFGGQRKECDRYNKNLETAKDIGVNKGLVNGAGMGLIFLIMFSTYALAFWYGSQLVINEGYTAGNLMIVFFCIMIGAFSIGNAGPNIQDFANSRGAAYAIFQVLETIPTIDSSSTEGVKPKITGNVEFKDVHFNYPTRETVPVLQGLNLRVNVGQTVALVGASGCGKSTTVALLQRFYDPLQGTVYVDGTDIKEINLKHLRNHIGVVSQEPILFGTTIAENISYGRDGVTDEEIEAACKMANAHNFILKLPQKYKTLVGERGAQLSGGQKQRIAIARALVRDPKILLLDEATSALDTESEASVQSALDKARMGRTTIVIAHRLSTIKTADVIAGFDGGVTVEQGTHDELMEKGGIYHQLVTNQSQKANDEDGDEFNPQFSDKGKYERSMSVQSDSSTKGKGDNKALARTTSIGSKAEEEEEEPLPDPSMKRVMRMNAPEWPYIVIGCIASVISGGVQPAFAIVFAEILGSFQTIDADDLNSKTSFYSCMFLVIGVVAGLSMFTMSAMFARSGEYLTMRMRAMTFKALLAQDIEYFDDHRNNVGALCTRLANDASAVKGATGSRLASMFQSLASLGAGIGIGFAYSWELTLLILAFAPFILVAGFIQMRVAVSGNKEANRVAMEGAGKVAIEGIENIRTVAALTKEDHFHADYCKCVEEPYAVRRRKAYMQGAAYGFSQGVVYFAYAAIFTLGAHLIDIQKLTFTNMFKVFGSIVFGAMSAGQATSYAPDYGKAKTAASRLFRLFDTVPLIDSFSEEGDKLSNVNGQVDLRAAKFNYPTRPDVPVLQGLTLTVRPGQTVALVGSSGCGKSTTVQLLERFYDPLDGTVCIDGRNIRDMNVQWLRAQMGIVSQEPVLFDCSIRENIAYGDNSREVSMAEIIDAAKKANIHNKIESLPLGYDTNTGDRGGQLSGGEKQRVAIARALIRNPKILLLDEATSALDTESEKVVQAALDKAAEGRTSIIIAHRLSTIQNADMIVVINNGQVAEMGRHSELLALKGIYYRLNNAQLRQK